MKPAPSSLSLAIRQGIGHIHAAFRAKLASYLGAVATRTTPPATRINSNPNATQAQMQRVQMMFNGEGIVKSSDFGANYCQKRRMYCTSEMSYSPDTGDPALDEELLSYLKMTWATMGTNNQSMQSVFSMASDVELPMRGDSALVWVRTGSGLKLMVVEADRIGELYWYYQQTQIDGLNYYSGIFTYPTNHDTYPGVFAAFKMYERIDQWYGNPAIYPASDVLFFRDNLMDSFRGVSKFAQCLPIVGNRDSILYATMQTMVQQSKVAAIASNNAGEPAELTYDTQTNSNGTVEYIERYADGPVVRYQYNGDSYQVLRAEHPTTSFQLAMDRLDEKGSLACGFPYSFLFSPRDSGGAPSRFEYECAGKEITRIRENINRPKLDIISYVTIMDAVERGLFPAIKTITRGSWNFGTLPSADAFRDDKSDILAVRAGTKTRNDVTTANSGRPYAVVLRQETQEALAIARAIQDANEELTTEGYDPVIAKEDIAQNSDNPQQAAMGETIAQGKGTPSTTIAPSTTKAALAAFMGDVTIGDLPQGTRDDIQKILGTNGHTDQLKAIKYGMVAPELERMADSHNLETAQQHIRYSTNASCAEEVHANDEKHILVNNGKVVDGHHHLAKALKGKVTKSLPVIDLTPTRFQTAELSGFDESKHPRNPAGNQNGGEFESSSNSIKEPKMTRDQALQVASKFRETKEFTNVTVDSFGDNYEVTLHNVNARAGNRNIHIVQYASDADEKNIKRTIRIAKKKATDRDKEALQIISPERQVNAT